MRGLSPKDCAGLLDLIVDMKGLVQSPLLPRHLLSRLLELIPCDLAGFHAGALLSKKITPHYEPEVARAPVLNDDFWEIEKRHPLSPVLRLNPNRAWKPSDVVSQAAFLKTEFFNVLYRPLGIRYEMVAMIPVQEEGRSVRVLALHRETRDFSERDRTLINLLLPPLAKLFSPGAKGWIDKISLDAFENMIRHRTRWELTFREMEVLYWLGQGKSNAEIGMILGISPRTAETHALKIYPKLGVENRYGAIVQLERLL